MEISTRTISALAGVELRASPFMVETDTSRTVPPSDLNDRAERNARRWAGRWPGGVDMLGRRRTMEPLESLEVHPTKPMDEVYRMGNVLYAHPETIRRVEKAIREQAMAAQDELLRRIWFG